MAEKQKKSVRKLVTLPLDLAERVELYRQKSGATSESDALKTLIEGGLRRHDTPQDLFQRCQTATASGQSIGDLINLVTADHPLVESTSVTTDALIVTLRKRGDDDDSLRFAYWRAAKKWVVEAFSTRNHEWRATQFAKEGPTVAPPPRRSKAELDDDIPF